MTVKPFRRLNVLGIPVDCLTTKDALGIIEERIFVKKKTLIFTPNIEHIARASRDNEFRSIYTVSDLSLADGMPVVWASRIFYRTPLPERINGTNMALNLCALAQKKGLSVFLLGSTQDIAGLAAQKLAAKYTGLKVAGYYSPPFGSLFCEREDLKTIGAVNASSPDILLVAFGAGKQEKWIYRYHNLIEATVFMGVGGSLDLISGRIPRAPQWMQDSGFEWLHMVFQRPARIKKYLSSAVAFIFLLTKNILKTGDGSIFSVKQDRGRFYFFCQAFGRKK